MKKINQAKTVFKNRIVIVEVGSRSKHILSFTDKASAEEAYRNAVNFWKNNSYNAVEISGVGKVICLSSAVVASVTLFVDAGKKTRGVK